MTNREKYAEQILDIACSGNSIMVLEGKETPYACSSAKCGICMFRDNMVPFGSCSERLKKWSESEYIEKPKISESDRRFLDYIPDKYKWMARDESERLYVYSCKPRKDNIVLWFGDVGSPLLINDQYKVSFPMIKWEDEKPWLIEDLKKLEVEE